MKWVCLMANMTLPGVGTLICKRWVTGTIQSVGSVIGFSLLGYCVYEFYLALQNYSASMDGEEVDGMLGAVKQLSSGMMGPLVTGAVGVIILKVMWIWAQVTTAQVFKAEKAAEVDELELAKCKYESALESLRRNGGKDNRIEALIAGRHYADIARKNDGGNGRAIFDEVALQNDLAAYGGNEGGKP
jgi:hypothetical protein